MSEKIKSIVVLMTATVKVGSYATGTTHSDSQIRLEEYAKGLEFWLTLKDHRISGIVFCENSGSDITRLKELPCVVNGKKPVEWIQTTDNQRPAGTHYGYPELGLIDEAINRSNLLANASHFAKVTGRLTFPNFKNLLDRLDKSLKIAIDLRRSYRSENGARARARTQLFIAEIEFYKSLVFRRRTEMLGLCTHIEEFLASRLLPLRGQPGVLLRFPVECSANGYSGATGKSYQDFKGKFKAFIRANCRIVAPWLWL